MEAPKVTEIKHINGLLKVELDTFYDYRGYNFEGYNPDTFSQAHPFFKTTIFPIDSFSKSSYGVLRGFHGDTETNKLIQVLAGAIQFVVIDARKDSPTFGNSYAFYLQSSRPTLIMVPKGCVNAHLCLSDECLFTYKLSHAYVEQAKQLHVRWDSYTDWDIKRPTLSLRDS